MEKELVKQRIRKKGTVALYYNNQLERLVCYGSPGERKEIIGRWERETKNLNNISVIINPEL